ncbi:PQQ-binding-like beta-propeller repeat protein [Algicella marina]|uniref:PQQ-binding-like beta-propeller repeat protein n=1 Tax=Algicella marina TaxID=2683284 RepID=A0A6P1SZ77_9RHOB|nr:PQQ-binding-like beta-propeller repeat protein [Algicella marina]QHQ34771.1 PQQ-binding-like beta-propeller repeat protein [Algicella marina]
MHFTIMTPGRLLALLLPLLAACSEPEVILPGERESIRPGVSEILDLAEEAGPAQPVPLSIPAARANADWTHVRGNSVHIPGHLALSATPQRIWSTSVGAGDGRRVRILASPMVAEGRIYTLDSNARATAVSTAGRILWQTALTPEGERAGEGFGGGFAYEGGALVVTTGFGEVLRLDPSTGDILWRRLLDGAIRAAPAVSGDRVVAISRHDVAYGIDLATGELEWQLSGASQGAGLLGGASPAIRGPVAILPFQSGEVTAALVDTGRGVWSAAVSGGRREFVRSRIGDISGDPVIDIDIVYAASQAGRLVALDRRSGERLWTMQDGAYGPVLPVGGDIFMVSDIGELLRLRADTGKLVWKSPLPEWKRPEIRKNAVPHFGPLLAGGRLIVASGDGLLRSYNPLSGAYLGSVEIPAGAGAAPAIAGGVLYVVTTDGVLVAYQ